jgi:hypothetical protein
VTPVKRIGAISGDFLAIRGCFRCVSIEFFGGS